jgi:(5-formylfuran-3-yl)methyl phosphate transaminase
VQQNFFISACAFVQRAGIAALREAQPEVDAMVAEYGRRRLFLVEALRAAGLSIPHAPEGAFYVLADARRFDGSSRRLADDLLREAGVACTPGVDFGSRAEGHLRFSYANSLADLSEGARRLAAFLAARPHA